MFKSQFTDNEKRSILNEKISSQMTVREICAKYQISIQTYYLWMHKFRVATKAVKVLPDEGDLTLAEENRTLRNLYINLSAHNFELAQFLKNE